MPSLSQLAQHTTKDVPMDGEVLTLTRTTKGIQGAFGKWLAGRAEDSAMSTADKYREQAIALREEVRALQEKSEDEKLPPAEQAKLEEEFRKKSRKALMLEAEARTVMERYADRFAAGEFEFHGTVSIDLAMNNLPGQFYLCWLMLKEKHPDITLDRVVELHKGVYLKDGKPVKKAGQKVSKMEVWRQAILEVEGIKNDEEEPKEGIPSLPTSTTMEIPSSSTP